MQAARVLRGCADLGQVNKLVNCWIEAAAMRS